MRTAHDDGKNRVKLVWRDGGQGGNGEGKWGLGARDALFVRRESGSAMLAARHNAPALGRSGQLLGVGEYWCGKGGG